MKRTAANQKQVQRAMYAGGAVVAAALLLPLAPAIADVFGGEAAAAATRGPEIVHLEIVARGVVTKIGQIAQPESVRAVFVGCPSGAAIGGGYTLPVGAKNGMTTSTPAADGRTWNFQYPGIMPVGTKLTAVCWRS